MAGRGCCPSLQPIVRHCAHGMKPAVCPLFSTQCNYETLVLDAPWIVHLGKLAWALLFEGEPLS